MPGSLNFFIFTEFLRKVSCFPSVITIRPAGFIEFLHYFPLAYFVDTVIFTFLTTKARVVVQASHPHFTCVELAAISLSMPKQAKLVSCKATLVILIARQF